MLVGPKRRTKPCTTVYPKFSGKLRLWRQRKTKASASAEAAVGEAGIGLVRDDKDLRNGVPLSILSLAGLDSGLPKAKRKLQKKSDRPSPRAQGAEKPKWGTPEEKYRRLCMVALLCRYAYYHRATSIVDDQLYDRLEATILKIEDQNRAMIHPRSPTVRVGSSREEDYPRSVRDIWERHQDDPKTLGPIGKAIGWFLEDAAAEFGV